MHKSNEKLDYLKKLLAKREIPLENVCIVGSFALELMGVRNAGDIDLVVSDETRYQLKMKFDKPSLIADRIEIVSSGWLNFMKVSDNDILFNSKYHIKIDSVKVIKLEHLVARKKNTLRNKDVLDLIKLSQFTFIDTIKFFKKLSLKFKSIISIRFFRNTRTEKCTSIGINNYTEINYLIGSQYNGLFFSRYDIILRYITASIMNTDRADIVNMVNIDVVAMYNKMQVLRGQKSHSFNRFRLLNEEFTLNEFPDSIPALKIDKYGTLQDGSHRLALSLYYKVMYLPTIIQGKKDIKDYSLSWFNRNGFSQNQLQYLLQEKHNVFFDLGIYYPVIIWPSASAVSKDIENELNNNNEVIFIRKYNFNLKKQAAQNFIESIYGTDDIDYYKITKKIEKMFLSEENEFSVYYIEIGVSLFRYKKNLKPISTKIELLKKNLRNNYKNKINNYFYDNLLHIPDNYSQNKHVNGIIQTIVKLHKKIE